MPRVISLIASATEIVCALGLEKDLVGRSHECDYPATVQRLPICTGPRFDVHGSSREIDDRVKQSLQETTSVYRVDADLLRSLRPDVIVTQAQCAVCAVSERDVQDALKQADETAPSPRIVTLSPNVLADVWQNIDEVAVALNVAETGRLLVGRLQERVRTIAVAAAELPKPRVACLEWFDPLMAAGNWMPELVQLAGGTNLVGTVGKHSPWLTMTELHALDPDVIIGLPCGFDLNTTRREMAALAGNADFRNLRAARAGQVYIADGNQFFNRPGPRLVESLEILAEILHPEKFAFGHQGSAWERCAF
jgi:iron complex transport system substrate-binding protein